MPVLKEKEVKQIVETLKNGVNPPPKDKAQAAAVTQAAMNIAAELGKKGSTSEKGK